MRRKCRFCLCLSCLKTCCEWSKCSSKVKSCSRYVGAQQLNIFDPPSQQIGAPRHSWKHYGISKARYRQLIEYIHAGRYASVARRAAHTANETIAEYILLSVMQNKSYDALRVKWELKEMEQIPYCRTDFYGIRRYFYHLFDKELRRIGK